MEKIKILIINPNSDEAMTRAIQENAARYAGERLFVHTLSTPGASPFVATYRDHALAVPGMVQLYRENEDQYDAVIVACHADPNLDLMKEIAEKPVVGISEASMKMATMLGHSFSVVAPGERGIPNKWALIDKYGLRRFAASVRPALGEGDDALIEAGRRAVEEDGAEVLVLGCAGFAGLDKKMQAALGVPVLDGVICALITAEGLVRAGLSISKKLRYKK